MADSQFTSTALGAIRLAQENAARLGPVSYTHLTFYTMITQATGAIINIILDPILIFGLFGFPRMEVAGAAVATVVGQICGGLLALFFNLTRNPDIKLS